MLGHEHNKGGQQELALVDGPENMRLYEYSVLVTSLDDGLLTIMQHYLDRADCENNFDETKKLQTSQIMACMIALVYN